MKPTHKSVFITGTAQGIGQALAIEFAKRNGAIIGCDLSVDAQNQTKELVEAHGGSYHALAADLSDREAAISITRTAAELETRHGTGFDILINNAGIVTSGGYDETDLDRWLATIDINLISLMVIIHTALPYLRQRPEAHIVNMSSIAGVSGAAGTVAYCTSKFGVTGLTRSLEAELEGTTIGISSVHPSLVSTRMTDNITPNAMVPMAQPTDVVDAVMDVIEWKKPSQFVPKRMRLTTDIIPRMFPRLSGKLSSPLAKKMGWMAANKDVPKA